MSEKKPKVLKPNCFRVTNVSNLEKWLNFTFCRRFGIVWPFLSSAEWRRCQAILWGDWGLPVSWIAALQLLTCKALHVVCVPKIHIGPHNSETAISPNRRLFVPHWWRGSSPKNYSEEHLRQGFFDDGDAVDSEEGSWQSIFYAQRYIGNHPQNGFFPENYGNCSDSVMRSGWLWWNDWSGCICKGQAEEAYGNFDRPDAACGWTDHPASLKIPKQSGPPKDFLWLFAAQNASHKQSFKVSFHFDIHPCAGNSTPSIAIPTAWHPSTTFFAGDQNVTLLLTLAALASPELCGSWTAWRSMAVLELKELRSMLGEHVHSRWCRARLGCAVLFKNMQMITNDIQWLICGSWWISKLKSEAI